MRALVGEEHFEAATEVESVDWRVGLGKVRGLREFDCERYSGCHFEACFSL